jgi:DNA-binding NarL/FixJ family response regulator
MNPILYPGMAKSISSLGRREEVLRCMWAGRATKEIAAELGISPKTVEYHRTKLYQLFGVRDPVSLCRRAVEAGLIELDGVKRANGRAKARGGAIAHAN